VSLATPVFVPGYTSKVSIQPSTTASFPSGTYADINVTGWDWEEKINAILTTHTGSGGVAERIAGVLDGSGTIMFNFDLANEQNLDPTDIKAGTVGLLKFFIANSFNTFTKFFIVPYIIESVPYKVVVDGKVEVQAKILMNSSQGAYTRPT
jgi:hypothetical protein